MSAGAPCSRDANSGERGRERERQTERRKERERCVCTCVLRVDVLYLSCASFVPSLGQFGHRRVVVELRQKTENKVRDAELPLYTHTHTKIHAHTHLALASKADMPSSYKT